MSEHFYYYLVIEKMTLKKQVIGVQPQELKDQKDLVQPVQNLKSNHYNIKP